MSWSIALVCESGRDRNAIRTLVDRIIQRHVPWIESEQLDDYRTFRGVLPADEFTTWVHLPRMFTQYPVPLRRGNLSGEFPRHQFALHALKTIYLLRFHIPESFRPHAVILLHDSENKADIRDSLAGVRATLDRTHQLPAVVAVAHTEIECWAIAGFDPSRPDEQKLLEQLLGDFPPGIGFDPRNCSEELTATGGDQHKLSPKRVCRHLTGENDRRELESLERAATFPREQLIERGRNNGLHDFISDVESHILPLFGGRT